MKLKLLFLSVLGSVAIANAQYTVTDKGGNVINDGDVIEFGTLVYPDASLDFYVTNDNPSTEIYTRIEFVSESNSAFGTFEQLCYGLCYNDLETGATVPPATDGALTIGIGETTLMGNHFWSNDPGNGTDNVDFVFAFRQYEDPAGTIETGTPLLITYRFNPTLGVNTNSEVNLTILSTIVSNQLELDVNEPVQMMAFDLQGRVVKQVKLEAGRQSVNVSALSPQVYILQFKNERGATETTKIIVQ